MYNIFPSEAVYWLGFLCCLKDIKDSVYICGADKMTIKSGIKTAIKSGLDPLLLTRDICG